MFEAAIRSHPSATGNVTATKETIVATNILVLTAEEMELETAVN